jgi:hypothetical protein
VRRPIPTHDKRDKKRDLYITFTVRCVLRVFVATALLSIRCDLVGYGRVFQVRPSGVRPCLLTIHMTIIYAICIPHVISCDVWIIQYTRSIRSALICLYLNTLV